MCLKDVGKVKNWQEMSVVPEGDGQEPRLEKQKELEGGSGRRKGQQGREAQAWPSSRLPSAAERLCGA